MIKGSRPESSYFGKETVIKIKKMVTRILERGSIL
jgi:hypothetical protein